MQLNGLLIVSYMLILVIVVHYLLFSFFITFEIIKISRKSISKVADKDSVIKETKDTKEKEENDNLNLEENLSRPALIMTWMSLTRDHIIPFFLILFIECVF